MSRTSIDRRSFLVSLGRYSAAGSLVAGCAYLATRDEKGDALVNCFKPLTCGQCSVLGNCTLPKAVAFKDLTEPGGGDARVAR